MVHTLILYYPPQHSTLILHFQLGLEIHEFGIILRSDALIHEYSSHSNSLQQEICNIIETIDGYRKVNGDGNCFYRAFGYQYLEYLSWNRDILEAFIVNINLGQDIYRLTQVEATAGKRQFLVNFLYRMAEEIDKNKGLNSEWVYQNYKGKETLN